MRKAPLSLKAATGVATDGKRPQITQIRQIDTNLIHVICGLFFSVSDGRGSLQLPAIPDYGFLSSRTGRRGRTVGDGAGFNRMVVDAVSPARMLMLPLASL